MFPEGERDTSSFLLLIISDMSILCNHINLQKSRAASLRINGILSDTPLIGLFQEPYTVQNKVFYRPQGYKVIPEATCVGVPRAALFIPSNLQAVTIGHLNTVDSAVATDFLIASVYLDANDDVVQPWLTNIVEYGYSRNMAVIIGKDSNAHSSLFCQAELDERGDRLEDFIFEHDLDIVNVGSVATFQTFRAQSVIEVTLTRGAFLRE